MAEEQIRDEIISLLRRAGVQVPAERLPALKGGLAAVRASAQALAPYEYALAEPACRFSAPPRGPRQSPDSPRRR